MFLSRPSGKKLPASLDYKAFAANYWLSQHLQEDLKVVFSSILYRTGPEKQTATTHDRTTSAVLRVSEKDGKNAME